MIIYKDEVFGFFEIFNEENGTLFRSDINGVDPVMRSFPELLDVGIMGHCNGGQYCRNAGIDCYQKGFTTYAPHMSYENFMEIVKQAAGKTFQIALGGAGDPNKHPQIEDILKSCRAYRIIPNMTTSGFLITDNEVGLIKQYCGAVAVSWYSRFMDGKESNQETIDAVERLVKSGCTTNIHYVVSKDTINEAITRLEMDSFPKGVNAVIFILYAMEINEFQETTEISLGALRRDVSGFVAPQMYIYLDGTELLDYIENKIENLDGCTVHDYSVIKSNEVCVH